MQDTKLFETILVFSVNYFGRFASIVLAGSDHVDRYQQH